MKVSNVIIVPDKMLIGLIFHISQKKNNFCCGIPWAVTLVILMDYPIHIDTISMELSILYFKGLPVKMSITWCNSVHEDCVFILANSADPDEMLPNAAFHLGLHCFPKYRFTCTVSRMKLGNGDNLHIKCYETGNKWYMEFSKIIS